MLDSWGFDFEFEKSPDWVSGNLSKKPHRAVVGNYRKGANSTTPKGVKAECKGN
jgi:hypothetical protein